MKKVTQKKIAEDLGLSQAAVSLILNRHSHIKLSEETKRKVWEHADKLGYLPSVGSRGTRGGKIRSVGVLHFGAGHELGTRCLTEVIQRLQEHGYTPLVFDLFWFSRNQEKAITHFLEAKIEGLVLSGYSRLFELSALEVLYRERIPVVGVRGLPIPEIPQWFQDKEDSFRVLAGHCLRLGHESIGLLTRKQDEKETPATSLPRLGRRGVEKAFEEAGVEPDIRVVEFENPFPFTTRNPYHSGYEAMREMHRGGLPAAVLCHNDIWAVAAIRYCLDHGIRVPEDVAFTGRDNDSMSRYAAVPLTTLDPNIGRMVTLAINYLVNLIESGNGAEIGRAPNYLTKGHLVVRRSCGSPYTPETEENTLVEEVAYEGGGD